MRLPFSSARLVHVDALEVDLPNFDIRMADTAGAVHFRALALRTYYDAAQQDYAAMLKAKGYTAAEIGEHAGLADTSLALALDPALVREDLLGREPQTASGVRGDPRKATAALGQPGIDHIVDASVKAIRDAVAAH